jgi:hypothetical protein
MYEQHIYETVCHMTDWPCLLMDRNKISNLYKRPSIDASYQVSVHLAEGFQKRRLKGEQLTDDGHQVMAKAHVAN